MPGLLAVRKELLIREPDGETNPSEQGSALSGCGSL